MTAPQYGDKETVEVRVRVSPQAAAILRRQVEKAPMKETLATRAGRILTAALLEQDRFERDQKIFEKVAKVKADPEKRTVIELSKTHSAMQISTLLRMPYKAVMAELGKGVDDIVLSRSEKKDREDMPNTYGGRT